MTNHIDDYVKRPLQYQNIDGLGELTLGAVLTGDPLLTALLDVAPSNSIWHHKTTVCVCFIVFLLLVLYGQRVLKKRITYPRTGYVKYRHTTKGVWRIVQGVLIAVAVALLVVFAMRRFELPSFKMPAIALMSVGWGLMYAMLTRLGAAWRWAVLVAMVLVPPAITTLPLDQLWLDLLPFVSQGLIFFISGTIGFALYLRHNPLPGQATE